MFISADSILIQKLPCFPSISGISQQPHQSIVSLPHALGKERPWCVIQLSNDTMNEKIVSGTIRVKKQIPV